MARSAWMFFGLVLVVMVSATMMGAAATVDEERAAASDGVGGAAAGGGEVVGGETAMGAIKGDDRGVGLGTRLEEGEASSIGGGDDSTFKGLLELSSRSCPTRLCQNMIFKMFEAERRHRRQSCEGTSAVEEEEELGLEDGEDADFDMEAEASGGEEDEEAQEAEVKEQPAQVHRRVKRRRIHEGVGIADWSTLQGDGPLESYRRRPAAMRHFRTIRVVRYALVVSSNVGHITSDPLDFKPCFQISV